MNQFLLLLYFYCRQLFSFIDMRIAYYFWTVLILVGAVICKKFHLNLGFRIWRIIILVKLLWIKS